MASQCDARASNNCLNLYAYVPLPLTMLFYNKQQGFLTLALVTFWIG